MHEAMEFEEVIRPGSAELRRAGYELVRRLGVGGMGEIWAAAKVGVGGAVKPCAIKVIRREHAEDPYYRRLFVAEGRLSMILGHASIVSVFDVGAIGRVPFMAMEWIDGVDLDTFRRRVQHAGQGLPMSISDAAHVAGSLLDALGYAHELSVAGCEHGIVHRDVSPRNVMITSRGEVKLMDFGLAGVEAEASEGLAPRFRGTLRYLSREQARGRPRASSDLFAVGAILHELLDGRRFRYPHEEEQALVAAIFEEGIPPLERRVPPVIEELRRGLLEPRAELRFRTARRALSTLASWPGHRDRRLQLEELYRRVVGAPRSGLTQLLSLGVHSELLDGVRRRVDQAQAQAEAVQEREAQRTVPWDRIGARDEGEAVVRARPAARVEAHRVAPRPDEPDGEGEPEDEITAPWPGRERADQLAESATAWLLGEDARARVERSRAVALPSLLWAVLGGLSMLAVLAVLGVPRLGPRTRGTWQRRDMLRLGRGRARR